ncbi:DUF1488 family protein [Vreelandella janggokensis]|uniref:DUF1488 domain-containing protein n=1 Tax=Vreelandella janggokensis TaxID=370767 RepID=A0ABT4IZ29_9GAMM|nr:DUF1488 family protein [Halomonas janggokensis]MCZ0928403.1 DUF1488 domain-containing protein [Halomonas janggokensis]
MNIEFTGAYAQNENFGINFQAKVDGQFISCVVTTEALQDINPSARMDEAEQQYLDNQSQLEAIAEEKIQSGQVQNGKIYISQSDVV